MSCSIIREEIGENLFFTGNIALFFKTLCFQKPLGSWRNGLLTSTLIVKSPCGPLHYVSGRLSCFIRRGEIGENIFFTGKIAFFFKNSCFQQPLGSWRNDVLTSTLIVTLPCGPLQVVSGSLSCTKIREEVGQNLFTGKIAFFFKNLCFQQPLGSWRNFLITSTLNVKLPCRPL